MINRNTIMKTSVIELLFPVEKVRMNYNQTSIYTNLDSCEILGRRAVAVILIRNYEKRFTADIDVASFYYQNALSMSLMMNSIFKDTTTFHNLCKTFCFMNTIFCVANRDTEEEYGLLSIFLWKFLQSGLANGLQLTGYVTYGDVFVDEKNNIVIGEAISHAYLSSKKNNFFGIEVDKSILERYEKLFTKSKNHSLYRIVNFTTTIDNSSMTLINWRFGLIVEAGTKKLLSEFDDEDYINSSLNFAQIVLESGMVYILKSEPSNNFLYISNFYIGKNQPPFEHGDEY